nr:hypothetical protein CFP56_17156 [Quercus suber]
MKQGLAFHDLLDHEGDPNQGHDHDEAQLPSGEERRPVNRTDSDKADVREGIDTEESDAVLRLFKLDVAEEDVWVARARVRVVGDEGLGEKREFIMKGFKLELRLVVELGGVEEDEEVVGS